MSDYASPAGMIESELLVATCASDGTILFRNTAWMNVFGSETDLWENLQLEDRDIAKQNFKEASSGSLVTNALFMVDRIDRDIPVPVLLHFIPVADRRNDSLSAVALSGEVLSEPSSWTESQTQRHWMETLGRMTMGMAHDFNNMLSGILGHIELWRIEGSDNATDQLAMIERAARDGADLISKVQRYIRQEARNTFEPIDLPALIAECISFTKPYWLNEPRRQGIEIDVTSHVPELPTIEGSPSELRDVFVNLILNAVHALPTGGDVTFTGKHSPDWVEVYVADTGTGMSAEVQRQVFDPLFSTKGERGTGMGLAVAAGILREHGGTIAVHSELGKGTRFTLGFPTVLNENEGSEVHVAPVQTPSSRRILVVDDEDMVRNIISKLLSVRGHSVVAASSGSEALQFFQSQTFDFVITDQGMPEMSGRELAYQIRKLSPTVPIVLLTGDTDLRTDASIINRVMTKPFKINDLELAMTELS
jgi:two-component system, cell cycle sensor histidine kinase and response regulator CckA